MSQRGALATAVILIVIGACAVTAVAVALTPATAEEDSYDASDLTGHWYLVKGYGVNDSGRYTEVDSSNVTASYGMDIIYQHGGLIYGYYIHTQFTGGYENGIIDMKIPGSPPPKGPTPFGSTGAW